MPLWFLHLCPTELNFGPILPKIITILLVSTSLLRVIMLAVTIYLANKEITNK